MLERADAKLAMRDGDDNVPPYDYKKPKGPVVIASQFLQAKLAEYDAAINASRFKRFYKRLYGDPADITQLRLLLQDHEENQPTLDEKEVNAFVDIAARAQIRPGETTRAMFDAIEEGLRETIVPIAFLTNLLARYDQQKGLLRKWWKGDLADIVKLRAMVSKLQKPLKRNLTIQEQYELYEIVSAQQTVPGHLSADIFAQIRQKLNKGTFLHALDNLKEHKLYSPEHYAVLSSAPPAYAVNVARTIITSEDKKSFHLNNIKLTLEMKQAMALNGQHAHKIKKVLANVPILVRSLKEKKYTEQAIFEKFKLLLCQQGQYADELFKAILQIRQVLKMDYIEKIACSPKDALWIAKALKDEKTAMQPKLTKEQIVTLCERGQAAYLVDFAKIKFAFDQVKLWDDGLNKKLLDNIEKIGKLAEVIHSYHPSYEDIECALIFIKWNFEMVLRTVDHAKTMIGGVVVLHEHQKLEKYQSAIVENPSNALEIAKGLVHLKKDGPEEEDKKAIIAAKHHRECLGEALGRANEMKGADKQLLIDHPEESLKIVELMGVLIEMKKFNKHNKELLKKLAKENPDYLPAMCKCLRQLNELKEPVLDEQLQNNMDQLFAQAPHCEKIYEMINVCQLLDRYHHKEGDHRLCTQKNIAALLLMPAEKREGALKILNFYHVTSRCVPRSVFHNYSQESFRHNMAFIDQAHYDLICKNAEHADSYLDILRLLHSLHGPLTEGPKNIIEILKLTDYYADIINFLKILLDAGSKKINKYGSWIFDQKPLLDQKEFEFLCANAAAPGFLHSLDNIDNEKAVLEKFGLVIRKARWNELQRHTFYKAFVDMAREPDPSREGIHKACSDMPLADPHPINNILLGFIGESFNEKPKSIRPL